MSIIAAGTTTTTALSSTGNTDGTIQLQVNGTTPSVTLNALGAVGVGASPNFGTSGQVLVSAGSTAAPTWATPAAVNLATGVTGTLSVTNGGTGATALTANNVLLGNGTSAVQTVAPGSSGNVLTSNGTTWQSTAPAPSAGTVTAVATGSISANATVVVNSDGTVSVVAKTVLTTPVFGDESIFSTTAVTSCAAVYDPVNNKVIVAYIGSSDFGFAVVGTISGSSISFGSPTTFISSALNGIAAAFDTANGKVVIVYTRSASLAAAIVGTVAGTSISFGTQQLFGSNSGFFPNVVYDSFNGRIVCAYQAGSPGEVIVGTVSGTSISFGTFVEFESANTTVISMTFDSGSNRVVIAYRDNNNSSRGTAIVGTVSGTSISLGAPVVFQATTTTALNITYSTLSNKVVIAYKPATGQGTAIVGTVSDTSISFGTPTVFRANEISEPKIVYDPSADRVLITYIDVNSGNASTAIVGTISGTSISFGTSTTFAPPSTLQVSLVYYPVTESIFMAYRGATGASPGVSEMCQVSTTNMTSGNFIGFSQAAYTNGQTATIQTVGSSNNGQSALTPGRAYHVRKDGALGLLPTNPPVFAGTSLTSTRILVKG